MYLNGLELEQKLNKIEQYDKCNEDQFEEQGPKKYCISLF